MKNIPIWGILLYTFILSGCNQTNNHQSYTASVDKKNFPVIYIQPLGNMNETLINEIAQSVAKFYETKVITCKETALTSDILAKSKTRYDALKILNKYKSDRNLLIITEKDIAVKYKRRNSEEWGIFGLGFCPGKTCVVSTFRLKRNTNVKLFKERLFKVCIHEIGHNLGLNHCEFDNKCLMNDANGTISQVDKEGMYFCENCRKKLIHLTKTGSSVEKE